MIVKRDINKLSIQDRKEYLQQRKEILNDWTPLSTSVYMVQLCIYIIIIGLIVLPLWKIAFGGDIFNQILIIFLSLASLFKIFIVAGLITDAIVMLFLFRALRKLQDKYWKVTVKITPKRNK